MKRRDTGDESQIGDGPPNRSRDRYGYLTPVRCTCHARSETPCDWCSRDGDDMTPEQADDYMASQDPPAGSEVETILPLSRTLVEMRGDTYYAGSVVRRVHEVLQDLADELRAERLAIVAGDTTTEGVLSRLLDYAETAERVGREAMDGIDGEEGS